MIDGAIEEQRYAKLALDFPPPERFMRGLSQVDSNQAIRIRAIDIIDDPEFSPEWREFFAYHSSQAFWRDIVQVMGAAIRRAHPQLERKVGKPLESWTVKRRGDPGAADVILDAQFVINTPVKKPSSVRPAHIDEADEIFAGLLYMRPQDDETPGGDLAIYHFKEAPKFGGHYALPSAVVEDKVIAYQPNRFVAFINSKDSVHGVSPRPVTDRFRRYINFVALMPDKAFDIPQLPKLSRLHFWLKRRGTKSHGIVAKNDNAAQHTRQAE
jgi:hypothetical protein